MCPKLGSGALEGSVGPQCSHHVTAAVVRLKLNVNLAGGDSGTLTRGDYLRKPRS